MANGVTTVNIDKIKQLKENFSNLQASFSYTSYDTFKNGYINKCGDEYVKRMATKLNSIYKDIDNSYKNIKTWWDDYIANFDKVDASLKKETTLSNDINSMINQLGTTVKNQYDNPENQAKINVYLTAYEENPELANAISVVMEENDDIIDFESCYKKCLEDEGYKNIIMQNFQTISDDRAEEQYAKDHPIKSSKLYKKGAKFCGAVKDVYFGTGENIFGWGLSFFNGIENGYQNIESYFNYATYEMGLIDESDYLQLQSEIKDNELFDDEVVNDFINEDTSINTTKYSSFINGVFGGVGEQAVPFMATLALGPAGGLVFGYMDGAGNGAYDATMHQKEFIDSQPIILNQDLETGTLTYLYDGSKITVDSTGNIVSSIQMSDNEYYDTLAELHNMEATEKAAYLEGIWGGFSWFTGGKLAAANLFKNPVVNSTVKILIDSALGGAEVPVQSLIKAQYMRYYYDEDGNMVTVDEDASFGEKFSEAFDDNGGWKAVAQNAVMGGAMSAFGEIDNIGRANKYKKLYNDDPTAFADIFVKQGFSEEAAIEAMNKLSMDELITEVIKIEDLMKSGNTNKVDEEYNKIVDKLNGNDIDFTFVGDIKNKVDNIKDKISSIKDNANDTPTSYKFKKKKGKDKYNDMVSTINENHLDYNIMKELENMISNDSNEYYIGIHDTGSIYAADNIYDNGLILTGHLSSGVGDSHINTISDLELNINFSDNLLGNTNNILGASNYKSDGEAGYAMVVKIPKNVDFNDITYIKNGRTYLKPEYIVGEIEVKNGEIFSSPNTKFKNIDYKNVDIDASQIFASVAQKNNIVDLKTKMFENAAEIRKTIIETLEGQNIRVTDDIISKYVIEIEKGNYNVITRKNGARYRAIQAYTNYKQLEKQMFNFTSKNFDISSFKYSGKDVKERMIINGTVNEVYNIYSSPKYKFDICILENFDQSKSKYSLNGIYRELGRIYNDCPELAKKLKKVYLSSEVSPTDPLASIQYKMPMTSSAVSEGNGIISFFGAYCTEDQIPLVLAHELGHELDRGIKKGTFKYSTSDKWMNAINFDGNFLSEYSKRTLENIGMAMEDFADSVGNLYVLGNDKFKAQFPNRYEILKELLPSLCGGK